VKYNIKNHGDLLEKTYSTFITDYFPTYEKVWQIYIGNIGNDTKAEIPGYTSEREKSRQAFSEHTYTILQSLVSIHKLLEKRSFHISASLELDEKLSLHDNILLFFTHIGRIRDNIKAAAICLTVIDIKKLDKQFDEFYHKRHIPVHGRIMPILFTENEEPKMPVLSKNDEDRSGWNHKINDWPDISTIKAQSINSTMQELFWSLLELLKNVFGAFENAILKELNTGGFQLKFEYIPNDQIGISGFSNKPINVYGVINPNTNYSSSSTDGKHGSSGFTQSTNK
jgi:hypothetical protein